MSVVVVQHGDVATLVLQIHFVLQNLKGFVRTHIGIGKLWERGHKAERTVRMAGLLQSCLKYMVSFYRSLSFRHDRNGFVCQLGFFRVHKECFFVLMFIFVYSNDMSLLIVL